ncbi:hypothetical protein, partial [Acinetobacter baumannii]|uniref:hypothetical protein n=1 Tax=Acinetobacter baumannii TaxID=470 RepID=UPI003F67D9B6
TPVRSRSIGIAIPQPGLFEQADIRADVYQQQDRQHLQGALVVEVERRLAGGSHRVRQTQYAYLRAGTE